MIQNIIGFKDPNILLLDDDLGEFLIENSFDVDAVVTTKTFIEFWELVLDWQKEVQK